MSTSIPQLLTILFTAFCLLAGPVQAEEATSPALDSVDLAAMKRIGEMTTLGVRATAYISAVSGQAGVYRVAVVFDNEKTGLRLKKAQVGIKQRRLYGDTGQPIWMHGAPEQPEIFVSDIELTRKGTYLLIVGSKMEDDKKRQFTFQYYVR